MPRSSRKLLVFFLFFSSTVFFFNLNLASAKNVYLNFSTFSLRNFTLLGNSYLKNGVVGLTRDLPVPTTSSGTAIFNRPIEFYDPESNITASFSTRFSFSITNVDPSASGDGLSFFISSDNQTLGSPGAYLGLVNPTHLTESRFVAIEFDTRLDPNFNDPNDNHVGLDVDSLISIQTADLTTEGIELKTGSTIHVWIDYKNDEKNLKVFMSEYTVKPNDPILSAGINLSDYLKQFMYVGFSGSTEGSTELHLIKNWSFKTSGFLPLRRKFRPHNVSDSSVVVTPQIQVSRGRNLKRKIGFGLVIGGPAFCFALVVIFAWVSIKKYKKLKKQRSFKAEIMTVPRQFSYKELKAATRGFHSSRIVGHGAFGTVYKAAFVSSGTVSAVKRSKHSTHEGKTEFLAELSVIACLRHKNLVQLQGWCVENGELLLVYEFMANGSLDKALYAEPQAAAHTLTWPCRYNIAVGLASVLTYMHQECEQQVIHRDIKTSNVMLDANHSPRLGDFGLARLMDHDRSPVSTLTAGTMGYLAPEYLQCGKATEKTDVFSYGVVVLELACGRRPIEREKGGGEKVVSLVDWVWGLHSEGRVIEAADRRLNGKFDEAEMERLLLVGLSCANPDCSERPSMRKVLRILSNEADPIVVPKSKPTLIFSDSLPRLSMAEEEEESDCDGGPTKDG
ncbi:hypothetical protein Nepgr_007664 [Nepenthes gracilis]|uniref:non-specific serine/threonine protein kinase n=1 Tax=Nepenthes gracilis TaxID=150966 RepID=A0AAD3S7M5_NEPGR|nr:hypothetical protein Nepgr_007664 [Nepenthes gracilis]